MNTKELIYFLLNETYAQYVYTVHKTNTKTLVPGEFNLTGARFVSMIPRENVYPGGGQAKAPFSSVISS